MNYIYKTVDEIIDACYNHLQSNEVSGKRWGLPYHFYKPANTKYGSSQWLWDSGWHMIVWAHRNVNNSVKDLRTMLQFQKPNGFIPEMIFWENHSGLFAKLKDKLFGYSNEKYTDITQMPMLAYSVRAIWNATKNKDLSEEFVPKLINYFEWWEEARDPDNDGLVSIIHPWESGIDASPLYDPVWGVEDPSFWQLYPKFLIALRKYKKKAEWDLSRILEMNYFNVEDVGLNSVYAAGWGELGDLARKFDPDLAAMCKEKQEKFSSAIIDKCWSEKEGQFVSFYHTPSGEYVSKIETVQSLFPLLLDNLPHNILEQVVRNLKNHEKFWLQYPVPSTAKSEPTFDPHESRLLWRGPTWPCTTWLVMEGLLNHNYKQLANEILNRWVEMYKKNGIYEYHNPLTGEGEGERGLGMSTTIVDMIYRLRKVK
ncbi:MAG: trehalase family glycosidase [Promethearchaeia archaeon]